MDLLHWILIFGRGKAIFTLGLHERSTGCRRLIFGSDRSRLGSQILFDLLARAKLQGRFSPPKIASLL